MPLNITQSTTLRVPLKLYLTSDHVSAATGKTLATVISKNMGAFANPSAGATNATELASGWYYVDLSATDTGTLGPLIVRGTAASCDDSEQVFNVVAAPALKKNVALAKFPFVMTDSTTHAPKTGVTVTATRSLDGGAFGACANSPAEVSNGDYTIDLAAADLNANTVQLRFTGTASDDLQITLITTP